MIKLLACPLFYNPISQYLVYNSIMVVINTVVQLLVHVQITVVVLPVSRRAVRAHTLLRSQDVQLLGSRVIGFTRC